MTQRVWFVLLGFFIGGCSTVPHDAGFPDVESAISTRLGQHITWNRGSDADRQTAELARAMLANELSPDDAVQIALLNNQNLQATYEDLGIAQAEVVEAGLLRNPKLAAEVRFPSHARLPFEIDITQSFLDLLFLERRKRAANAAFEEVKSRVTHQVLATAADVRAAFYRAQGSAQIVEMRQNIAKATDASFDAAKRLREAGNITELALANERALHEQATLDLTKAQRDALDAREQLTVLLGLWGADIDWKLSPRLPDLPPDNLSQFQMEAFAISQRADLNAAKQAAEVAAQTLGITRSTAWFPDLSVGGHFEQDADGTTTVGPTVEIPLPIFNQGQAAVAAAQSRLRQSERKFAALAVEIRGQVRRAYNRMTAARNIVEYQAKVILPLRHKIVEETQLQYNAMIAGVFQLLQAKQAEIDAGREYVESLQEYWIARSELERAVGSQIGDPKSRATSRPASAPTQPATMPAEHHHHQ